MEMLDYNVHIPPIGRGRLLKGKHQLKKDFRTSECVKLKNRSDVIEIRATDRVIHDVRKKSVVYQFLHGFMLPLLKLNNSRKIHFVMDKAMFKC